MCVLGGAGGTGRGQERHLPIKPQHQQRPLTGHSVLPKEFLTWVHLDDPEAFRMQSQIGEDHSIFLFIKVPTQMFIFN